MRQTVTLGLLALALGVAQAQSGPRLRENFNQGWLFERQSNGSGALGSFDRDTSAAAVVEPRFQNAMQAAYDDSGWKRISLPHTWNDQDTMDETPGYWRGIGWYRKHFTVDQKFSGKRIFLEFEGANQVSEFWINGQHLGIHKSGYTSFEYDITPYAHFGAADNVLTVKVDNLFHAEIPPTVKTDYNFYGGIYRGAWLRVNDPVYVAGVYWTTPTVDTEHATLQLHSRVRNTTSASGEFSVLQEVLDPKQKVVLSISRSVQVAAGAAVDVDQSSDVKSPELWSPDTPNMYAIRTTLRQGSETLDVVQSPLGFRWFRFDAQKGFFLNGKRVQIGGVNWHQTYPGMGNALPNSRHWKDLEVIKEMGTNFWRTSHYPHAPATMEASDRLGLMVWEELPINKEIGNTNEYIANVQHMAKEMIDRDRNHPAIMLWGIAGEVNAPPNISRRVIAATAKAYRELDPTRPVVMHEPRGEQIEALVDVSGLGPGKATDEKHVKYPERSYMTGEYSAALTGRGIYGAGQSSEDTAISRHERFLREFNRRPWMAGGVIWNAFDYDGETYDVVAPHVVAFGVTDIWRIPKESYYLYQSQWSSKPMVHIFGHWTWPGQEGQKRKVTVFSNAPQVELFLGGRSLGIKEDKAADDLAHPARVWEVDYQPGTLRAVARSGGQEISDERRTAGPAYQIILKSDAQELRSGDPESLAYITAIVADKNGTPVPDAAQAISFTSYGPGELLPQTWVGHGTGFTWNVVGGMTRIAFRSTPRTGTATISAVSQGLRMGRTTVMISAPGKPDEMQFKEHFDAKEDEDAGVRGDETPGPGSQK